MGQKKTRTLEIQNNITLEDLRWLVSESSTAPPGTAVRVVKTRGDRPQESDTTTISVTLAE